MSGNTILCKFLVCLNQNISGVIVSFSTYYRHRKNQQEFLDVEETNIIYDEQTMEDIQQDIYQEENEYRQENQLDIVDKDSNTNSDTISFNFNEEDYSDNNLDAEVDNEEYNDYDEEEEEENDDNDEDDDDDDDDDDDYNDDNDNDMEEDIDKDTNEDISNKEIIEGLKLLHLKSLYNFTESAYNDILKILTVNNISLYKVKKYLKEIIGLIPVFYDMCENSCICYTGKYESYRICPICNSIRLDTKGKAKKVMPYLSVKDRLKLQFNDANRAKELYYRYEYITDKEDDDLNDIFDGKIYKELVNEKLFEDKRDVAFTASCDGYQIFKQKTDDCWLFLLINNNLHSSLHVKKENLLIPFLIPGPNQPKDFNTFLQPFIDEMKELERKEFILGLFIIKLI